MWGAPPAPPTCSCGITAGETEAQQTLVLLTSNGNQLLVVRQRSKLFSIPLNAPDVAFIYLFFSRFIMKTVSALEF